MPPRIYLGAPQQPEVLLSRQDWRGPSASWAPSGIGFWFVDVRRDADYAVTLRFERTTQDAAASLNLGSVTERRQVPAGQTSVTFPSIHLPKGPATLEAVIETPNTTNGRHYVEVNFIR